MNENEAILAIDIGGGTQDILVYQPGIRPENNAKLVLPSQTVLVGRRIARATVSGQDVFLTGNLMGGGASSRAVREHLQAGRRVYATPLAAKTIRDDLDEVRALGVIIVEQPPEGPVLTVKTGDVDLDALRQAFSLFDIAWPGRAAVAVQDHGECKGISQRRFRFQLWEAFLAQGGRLVDLAHLDPPPALTRMQAVQSDLPGAVLMDTAGAAIWGALQDARVAAHGEEGLIIVNAGNEHTLGALVQAGRLWGLFEHHTGQMNPDKLTELVARLRAGSLTNDEIYADGGHGVGVRPDYRTDGGFTFVAVTGPNWALADGLGWHRAAPHGDMMIGGCFGLVAAAQARWAESGA